MTTRLLAQTSRRGKGIAAVVFLFTTVSMGAKLLSKKCGGSEGSGGGGGGGGGITA
jgi:hypothetical protein